jgi:hypothetical protein
MVFAADHGNQLLLPIVLALIVGVVAGALRLHRVLKIALAVAAPGVAIAAYYAINPDPGCTYDCLGKLNWSIALALAVGTWWIGLSLGAVCRWLAARKARFVKPS